MRNFCAFFVLLLVLFSCKIDQKKKVDPGAPDFSTTDDSELFFRNLRQPFYDKEELTEAKLNQYRLSARVTDVQKPIINLCIVENWRFDEAYILLEPNSLLQTEDSLFIEWVDLLTVEKGQFDATRGNKEHQFRVAAQVYHSIQQNHQLTIKVKGEWLPFLAEQA